MDESGDGEDGTSSLVLFPDISLFEDGGGQEGRCEEPGIQTEWAVRRIGGLQAKIEFIQGTRLAFNRFRSRLVQGISSHLVIKVANEVFGFEGWSSKIVGVNLIDEDFDESEEMYSARYQAIVRVTLKDGTFTEAIGIGKAMKMPGKHMCHNKGKKMALTEALKMGILEFRELLAEYELHMMKVGRFQYRETALAR